MRRARTWIGWVAGIALAQACDRADTSEDARIAATCRDYCDQAAACGEDVDVEDCEAGCEGEVADCRGDEQEQVLDDLDHCAVTRCDELPGCPIGTGAQCTFGL